jgi:hypothetical protein
MTSILKVDTIQDTAGNNIINESGDTITIGASGDTVTTSANVGIGIASPSANLEVRGSSSNGQIYLGGSTAGTFGKIYSDNDGVLIASADGGDNASGSYFGVEVDGTERMRVLAGGQVVLGGTSWVGGGTTDSGLQIDMNTSTDATFGLIVRNGSNADSFIHKMNGSTFNTTGTFGSISDIRFKENIVDATSKLEEVKQLKVRNFNLIGEEEKYLGFIAQEIEQIFPNIVDTQAERTYEKTDDDGNVTTVTTPEKKLVKTTVLIPILTKALQEAIAKIEQLEARITTLENN